ncbi:MAG TPA: nickel pincer cofactor biosynthesis protein LarC, partial [Actinomycetota bacterium]|nr:nickel pincer cofactor biosynthesis protein LarC [Actinomycetota bacterium]
TRSYRDIVELVRGADLDEMVREPALQIFATLAEAEAAIHGVAVDVVHLHEVGSVDAIVDIVASCAALSSLAPELVITSAITTGRGITHSLHGPIPVPAPAVTAILEGATFVERGEDELITPTGAAILKTITDRFASLPSMRLEATGYGAGTRDTSIPNVLRVLLGEVEELTSGKHSVIEANVDDMSPELISHVIGRLLETGAQDAWVTPIVMKKGRPAFTVSALVEEDLLQKVLDAVYRETTTFGARVRPVDKYELERSWTTVAVEGYEVRMKIASRGDEVFTVSPEFDDALKVASITGLPLKEVYRLAQARYEAP